MKFSKLWKTKGGHSYWYEIATGHVYVADDSMQVDGNPTSTDDGGLILDIPLILERGYAGETVAGGSVVIPIKDRDGDRYSTACNRAEAQAVASYIFSRCGKEVFALKNAVFP